MEGDGAEAMHGSVQIHYTSSQNWFNVYWWKEVLQITKRENMPILWSLPTIAGMADLLDILGSWPL